jgi:hypothetical protein
MTDAQAETPSRVRLLRNRPTAETLLAEPGARYLPGRQMLGHQGEHVEEQLLHGMRGSDSAEGSGRAGMFDH